MDFLENPRKKPPYRVLMIDDEQSILDSLGGALEDEGFEVIKANSGKEGLQKMQDLSPHVVLLDIWMPDLDGLDVLRKAESLRLNHNIIVMTGHGTIETAVSATKLGAFDFIEKPISLEKLLISIRNLLDRSNLSRENLALKEKTDQAPEFIGKSQAVKDLQEKIKRVGPTHAWVLVTGENGTGKELIARGLHAYSERASKPMIEVNCAAIPNELIESELFGHRKGAFTGAHKDRRGKFEMADGGTLFLDEIGDMSLNAQAKVLRLLQEQRFERVGGSQPMQVDVRVIAATNKDLEKEIEHGRFREDLFYRLNVIHFHATPLRERKEDIPLMADEFIKEMSLAQGQEPKKLSPEVYKVFHRYQWPGNVRELKNVIESLMILAPDTEISVKHLPERMLSHESVQENGEDLESPDPWNTFGGNLREAKLEFEKEFILRKLKENSGNITKTAQEIGVERSNLHKKIKFYGIEL
jgi:two-component system nitrogen regulation response regulator NtrX